ncbi:MAG TPA: hypothetical protein VMP01_08020 [Pirellulaceae bacterium]|nr:hypothetical protein [Pirellulaceae bacterium]
MSEQHLFQCRTCHGNVAVCASSCPHCGGGEPAKSWLQVNWERAFETKCQLNDALLEELRALKPDGFMARNGNRLLALALVAVCSFGPYYFLSGTAQWIRFACAALVVAQFLGVFRQWLGGSGEIDRFHSSTSCPAITTLLA